MKNLFKFWLNYSKKLNKILTFIGWTKQRVEINNSLWTKTRSKSNWQKITFCNLKNYFKPRPELGCKHSKLI
jgi:hypothetical protein